MASDIGLGLAFLLLVGGGICVVIAYIISLILIATIAKQNGLKDITKKLVFIGIFLTPIVSGIYLIAASLKNVSNSDKTNNSRQLPRV